MLSWIQYLKQGLSRELPDDQYQKNIKYGRLRDNIKYLFPSIIKRWKLGVISAIVLVITSLLTYPQPMINKYLIDDVLLKKNVDMVIPVVVLMAIIWLGSYLLNMLKSYYQMRFSQEVILDLQEKLIKKVLALPKIFFDTNRTGYLMSRIRGDVNGVNWFISGTIVQLFLSAMRFIGGVGFLFYLEWRLAIPIMISLPIPFLLIKFFAKRSYIMSHHSSELNARSNANLQEVVSSVSLIKSFANETKALKNVISMFRKKVEIGYEQQSIGFLSSAVNQLMPTIAKLFIMLFGAYWVISGEWELGSLIAFQSYLMYVYGPVNQLSSSINALQSARATLDRLASMFELTSEDNTDTGKKISRLDGSIRFENVTFFYEVNNPVLNNISFEIKPKEHWALIGSSGIGKTTLISLILKFYKPLEGNIYFDGIDSSELNVRSLRERIGYVSQRTNLQSGSIMENLKYGNADASDEDVIKATKIVEIHDFIEELPNKYETVIEEDADNLSEGQKQRIAIARALVRNPDILILDEPTSSLDNITEKSIYQSLPSSVKDKTSITIAHKLHTIKSADKIMLIRKDKPPLIGSHEELKNEIDYKNIFEDIK